jgi:hypothetical protein
MSVAWSAAQQQSAPRQELLGDRILRMSEGYQIAFVNSDLDRGMPVDMIGPLEMLVLNRSSLVLPMIEKKIEEVLNSPNPRDCFTDKKVDPQYVIDLAAATIAGAGDEQALKETSKLLKIDSKRFDLLVKRSLLAAISGGKPFTIAYRGFEIGDPEVDKRIVAWAEEMLIGDAVESGAYSMKGRWAASMAEKYSGAPTEVNWANDPIASRLTPELAASLHDEILRLGAEAFEKRSKK